MPLPRLAQMENPQDRLSKNRATTRSEGGGWLVKLANDERVLGRYAEYVRPRVGYPLLVIVSDVIDVLAGTEADRATKRHSRREALDAALFGLGRGAAGPRCAVAPVATGANRRTL